MYVLRGQIKMLCDILLSIHHSERQSLCFLAKLDNSHWGKPVTKFLKHLVPFISWILADTHFLLHRAPDVFLFCLIQTSPPFFKISVLFLQGDRHLSSSKDSAVAEAASLLQCVLSVPGHIFAMWNWGSCFEDLSCKYSWKGSSFLFPNVFKFYSGLRSTLLSSAGCMAEPRSYLKFWFLAVWPPSLHVMERSDVIMLCYEMFTLCFPMSVPG